MSGQQQLEQLAEQDEAAGTGFVDDSAFFDLNPSCQYRMRLASQAEVVEAEIAGIRNPGAIFIPTSVTIPRDDLHELIELGYASKRKAIREAAGRVDTWKHKLTGFLHYLRMQQTKDDASWQS